MRSQLFCHGLCKTELWIYALEILGNCNRLPTNLILFDERHVDVPRQFGVTVISGRRRGMRIPKSSQRNEHAFTSTFIYEIHPAATQPQRPNIRSFWEPRAQRWEETIRRNHLVTRSQAVKDVPYAGAGRPVSFILHHSVFTTLRSWRHASSYTWKTSHSKPVSVTSKIINIDPEPTTGIEIQHWKQQKFIIRERLVWAFIPRPNESFFWSHHIQTPKSSEN